MTWPMAPSHSCSAQAHVENETARCRSAASFGPRPPPDQHGRSEFDEPGPSWPEDYGSSLVSGPWAPPTLYARRCSRTSVHHRDNPSGTSRPRPTQRCPPLPRSPRRQARRRRAQPPCRPSARRPSAPPASRVLCRLQLPRPRQLRQVTTAPRLATPHRRVRPQQSPTRAARLALALTLARADLVRRARAAARQLLRAQPLRASRRPPVARPPQPATTVVTARARAADRLRRLRNHPVLRCQPRRQQRPTHQAKVPDRAAEVDRAAAPDRAARDQVTRDRAAERARHHPDTAASGDVLLSPQRGLRTIGHA
jgi:hypothetical protein